MMSAPRPDLDPVVPQPLSDAQFKQALLTIMPELRAFARSLVGRRDAADDLVQDTLMRAWGARLRFQAGTNMRAWAFRILRNRQRTLWQRGKRWAEWDESAERSMRMNAPQEAPIHLAQLYQALQLLPAAQREALVLVGAGGMSHEEAAEICRCAVGTIKSRVSRGRRTLERLLNERCREGGAKERHPSDAFERILAEFQSAETGEPREAADEDDTGNGK